MHYISVLFCFLMVAEVICRNHKKAHYCQLEGSYQPLFLRLLLGWKKFPEISDCALACVTKGVGLQDERGKLNERGFQTALANIKHLAEEQGTYIKAKEILAACAEEVTDKGEECKTADAIFKCIRRKQSWPGQNDEG